MLRITERKWGPCNSQGRAQRCFHRTPPPGPGPLTQSSRGATGDCSGLRRGRIFQGYEKRGLQIGCLEPPSPLEKQHSYSRTMWKQHGGRACILSVVILTQRGKKSHHYLKDESQGRNKSEEKEIRCPFPVQGRCPQHLERHWATGARSSQCRHETATCQDAPPPCPPWLLL